MRQRVESTRPPVVRPVGRVPGRRALTEHVWPSGQSPSSTHGVSASEPSGDVQRPTSAGAGVPRPIEAASSPPSTIHLIDRRMAPLVRNPGATCQMFSGRRTPAMPRAGMGSSARPFGVGLPGVQQIPSRVQPWERELDGDALIAVARAAEDAGFAWVSASDHVAVPASRAAAMGATWYDAGSTLAFVAGGTRKIRLLAHVVVLPYRHPLVVAKQWGTLDRLSGGRVILGVGSGHLKPEFA